MKPELKAKREKLKKQVDTARKEIENSETMTKAEKDSALINIMMKKDVEEETIEVAETEKKVEVKDKHFICKCGMHVTLYGEAEQRKCSRCLQKENE
jgi:hypothetical protein